MERGFSMDWARSGRICQRTWCFPIRVDCRPVGSTATIIACKMEEHRLRPSAAQARLLLGAIVADTLLLRSPTTTEVDASAGIRGASDRWELTLWGRNITGAHYPQLMFNSVAQSGSLNLFPSDPATFGISWRAKY